MARPKKILVTGVAGFVGFHVAKRLANDGHSVLGVDSLNPYYSLELKQARLRELELKTKVVFRHIDLADAQATGRAFDEAKPDCVIHMAAQPGVRYSLENPRAYVDSNVVAFLNILENCRHRNVAHLVYASSSSVYGANQKIPFSVHDPTAHPVSLYAATKKTNELMAHTYSHLFGLPTTGLRLFTVYGPWGRPDMAVYAFTRAIVARETIKLFNFGKMRRDFTYIDDVVEAVSRVLDYVPSGRSDWNGKDPDPATSYAPYRLLNIGGHDPVDLGRLVSVLEDAIGIPADKDYVPMQPGDVHETYADTDELAKLTGFRPGTPIEVGIPRFVKWYRRYHNVNAA